MLVFPKKFKGVCIFDHPTSISRAIYRDEKEIVVEFESEGYLYTVNLSSEDGRLFKGNFQARKGNDEETGKVDGRLLWDQAGPVIVGNWIEGNEEYVWVGILDEVKEFDETKMIKNG